MSLGRWRKFQVPGTKRPMVSQDLAACCGWVFLSDSTLPHHYLSWGNLRHRGEGEHFLWPLIDGRSTYRSLLQVAVWLSWCCQKDTCLASGRNKLICTTFVIKLGIRNARCGLSVLLERVYKTSCCCVVIPVLRSIASLSSSASSCLHLTCQLYFRAIKTKKINKFYFTLIPLSKFHLFMSGRTSFYLKNFLQYFLQSWLIGSKLSVFIWEF